MRTGNIKSSGRLLIFAMAALLAGCPYASFAQDSKKPIRVGILVAGSLQQRGTLETALEKMARVGWLQWQSSGVHADQTGNGFVQGLREGGFVEGKNLVLMQNF